MFNCGPLLHHINVEINTRKILSVIVYCILFFLLWYAVLVLSLKFISKLPLNDHLAIWSPNLALNIVFCYWYYFVPGIMLIISTLYNLDLITNIETQDRYFHFAQGDSF